MRYKGSYILAFFFFPDFNMKLEVHFWTVEWGEIHWNHAMHWRFYYHSSIYSTFNPASLSVNQPTNKLYVEYLI